MAATGNLPTAETVRERLRPMLAGRPVVVAGTPLAGATRMLPLLTELSGRIPFVLATGVGTGPLPDPGSAVSHVLPARGDDVLTSVRSMLATLVDLPADALAALDAYDPAGEAVVLAGAFFTGRELAGRRVLDGRLPEWETLEDKTVVDALWDDCGVARAPSTVVACRHDDLLTAARSLDDGAGTVWHGDAREGFNGGAEYVRWVRSADDARRAHDFLGAHCDRVRVMPFLTGTPCSVHGIVLPDGVVALRPVEMVVLHGVGAPGTAPQFVYGGISTYWDPPAKDREQMRDVARRVARGLARSHGFRGGFSVDGVLTDEGFLPTELNSRFAGGLGVIGRAVPELPLALVQAALVSGHDPGVTAAELETLLLSAADAQRSGGGARMLASVTMAETDTRPVAFEGTTVRLAAAAEEPDGELMLGPAAAGAFLRFEPFPGRCAVGQSVAPLVSSAFALADELWGTGIGPTVPAAAHTCGPPVG